MMAVGACASNAIDFDPDRVAIVSRDKGIGFLEIVGDSGDLYTAYQISSDKDVFFLREPNPGFPLVREPNDTVSRIWLKRNSRYVITHSGGDAGSYDLMLQVDEVGRIRKIPDANR